MEDETLDDHNSASEESETAKVRCESMQLPEQISSQEIVIEGYELQLLPEKHIATFTVDADGAQDNLEAVCNMSKTLPEKPKATEFKESANSLRFEFCSAPCDIDITDQVEVKVIQENFNVSNDLEVRPATTIELGVVPGEKTACESPVDIKSYGDHGTGHVGLVNRAMTCYANSILQAMFMTPELRNGLYKWKFDGTEKDERKSIPYQLQKLFLKLQTSKCPVETTELIHSFDWDSSEKWQQHDVQEFCRVMFDALERGLNNSPQANLISSLYEGKLKDSVKCLECNLVKSREDKFLDISLPICREGNIYYHSVEEALRAFVQPELLIENNQYYCENCNKNCDSVKQLRFLMLPHLLTLHFKRFIFDTDVRRKLHHM